VSTWIDSIQAKFEVATMNLAIPFLKMLHIKFLQQSITQLEYKNINILWESLKKRDHFKNPRQTWENNLKMDLK
jgi:type III secretory pathway lipoprotein EscJ